MNGGQMKVLKLKGYNYLNHKGIIMSQNSEPLLATEATIAALDIFIKNGIVVLEEATSKESEVVKIDEEIKFEPPYFAAETIPAITPAEDQEIKLELFIPEEETTTEKFELATLEAMTKEKLLVIAKELGIEAGNRWKVAKIVEAIIEFQK
jgi:hypothetical protein